MANATKSPIALIAVGFVLFLLVLAVTFIGPGKLPFLSSKSSVTPTPTGKASAEPTVANQNSEKKPMPTLKPTNVPPFDLKAVLSDLMSSSEKEIKDTVTGNYNGCRLKGNYIGRMVGSAKYSLNESDYVNASAAAECQKQSLNPTYSEIYWISPDIFLRQSKQQNFEKVASDSSVVKASDPTEYLNQILIDPTLHKIIATNRSINSFDVETSISNQQYSNSYVFTLTTDNKIRSIDYEASGSAGFLVTGHLVIATPSALIVLPTPPDRTFLSSALEDIYSFNQISYEVQTERYIIGTDKNAQQIRMVVGEGTGMATKNCDLTTSACQGRLLQLRTLFTIAKLLVFSAEPGFCGSTPLPTGAASQTLKNHMVMEIINEDRNSTISTDYSALIDFVTEGDKKYDYTVKLKKSTESCYTGKANQQGMDILLSNLVQFATGF